MNKIYSIMVLAIILCNTSCSKFVDGYEISPNSPSEVTPSLLTTALEVSLFNTQTGQLARTSSILSQSLSGNNFQMVDVETYNILEGDNQNEWDDIYSKSIINSQTLYDLAGAENPHYQAIALIIKTMALATATDLWGDVPNTEAGKALAAGAEGYSPKYDSQQDVYKAMQANLDEAISLCGQTANIIAPGGDDLIFGGAMANWKAVAWALKARLANHLSKRDPSGSASEALRFVDEAIGAGFNSSAANFNAVFGSAGNELNSWFAFNNSRGNYLKVSENLVTMLESNSDPRLGFYADTAVGGSYIGNPVGNSNLDDNSNIGSYLLSTTATISMFTFAELKFIEAEAAMRVPNMSRAATAYNEALSAAVIRVVGDTQEANDFITANTVDETTVSLEKIMNQKYLNQFGHLECYTDWRRTGFPQLSPNPNGLVSGIPRRLPTPLEERLYNVNAKITSNILTPVWWDE